LGLKVIAFPLDGYSNLFPVGNHTKNGVVGQLPADWEVVQYSDPKSLAKALQSHMSAAKECLEVLEIDAQGNQLMDNGLTVSNISLWAKELNLLDWCGDSSIYLTSCLSGLQDPVTKQCIAQAMSALVPDTTARTSTIYGTKGYL